MQAPSDLCCHAMTVRSITQETPDVWTLTLVPQGQYTYQAGQFAMVAIRNDPTILRSYTISSTPNDENNIQLTIRRIEGGIGSTWLTNEVNIGDILWLSSARGEFTCLEKDSNHYLMLAAGCGVTPIISMTRWLLTNRTHAHITVFYHIRSAKDMIFSQVWQRLQQQYPNSLSFYCFTEEDAAAPFLDGRLTQEAIKKYASSYAHSVVMCCGPIPYMDLAEKLCLNLEINPQNFFKEQFLAGVACDLPTENILLYSEKHHKQATISKGMLLLEAMEQAGIPALFACRTGVCGACKVKVVKGDYQTNSQQTLTPDEIAQGVVLSCSCRLISDTVIE